MGKLEIYKEALEFIAGQKDKVGNWAVERARMALDEASQQENSVEWINPCTLENECSINCIESIQIECRLYLASIN